MTTADTVSTVVPSPWPDLDIPDVPLTAFLLGRGRAQARPPRRRGRRDRPLADLRRLRPPDRASRGRVRGARPRPRATWWRSSPPTRPSGSSPATARSRRAAWSAASTRSGPPTRSPRRSTTPPPGSSSPPAPSRRPHGPPPRRRASAPGWCCSTGTPPTRSGSPTCSPAPTPAPDVVIDPAVDLALLPYSSGTTGLPKGVMLTHRACVANVLQTVAALRIGPDDRTLAVAPLSHAVGWGVVANCALPRRGDGRHPPPVRAARVPRRDPGAPDHPDRRGAAGRARAGPPPRGRRVRPVLALLAGLRCGPAGRRPAAGVHGPAGDPGGAGLRDDRGRRHDRGRPHRHRGASRAPAGSCCPACRPGSTR